MKTLKFLFCILFCFIFASCDTGGDNTVPKNPVPAPGDEDEQATEEERDKIHLNRNHIAFSLPEAGTYTLRIVNPQNADYTVSSWETSDESVATVSNGTVTAISAGIAGITVKIISGSNITEDTCGVVVLPEDTSSADLKTKFAITKTGAEGVRGTFTALHYYLGSLADPADALNVLQTGDYILLPTLNVAVNPKTNPMPGYINSENNGYINQSGLKVVIVSINPYLNKNGNGNTAHVIFDFEKTLTAHSMNYLGGDKAGDNSGGYKASELRKYLIPYDGGCGNFLAGLIDSGVPEDVLFPVKRYIWGGTGSEEADLIEDKVWLPSEREITGENVKSSGKYETADNQAHFEWFNEDTYKKTNYSGSSTQYILASPCAVSTSGTENKLDFCIMNYKSPFSKSSGSCYPRPVCPFFAVY